MTFDLTAEQEARVVALAERNGRSVAEVMGDTAVFLLESEEGYRASMKRRIEQADRGEFIEEEEMDARVARMLQPK